MASSDVVIYLEKNKTTNPATIHEDVKLLVTPAKKSSRNPAKMH